MDNDSLCIDESVKFNSLTMTEQKRLRQFLFSVVHNKFLGKWSRFDKGNEFQYLENSEEGLKVYIDSNVILYQNVDLTNLLAFLSSKFKYIEEPIAFNMYDDRSVICENGWFVTHKMMNCSDNCLYAVQVIKKDYIRNEIEIENDVNKFKDLSHVNICKYYDYFCEGNRLHIVSELITGETLYDKITNVNVTLEDKIKWFKQIASTLYYIHDKEMLHGNIKPENIFITSDGDIKLINIAFKNEEQINRDRTTIGLIVYHSFEKHNCIPYDYREDMWALGYVMAELFLGKHINIDITNYINPRINEKRLKLLEECKSVNYEYGTIISKMLEPEIENRCTSRELVEMLN